MSDVAGAIGEGRVLVLQPAVPTGAGLELGLGIQRFWQKALKAAGRPAVSLIAHTRVEKIEGTVPDGLPIAVGDKGVLSLGGWSDETRDALVVQHGCRWCVATTITPAERSARLDTVLVEAKVNAPVRSIASWSFDASYVAMPAHVVGVLVETALRIGTRLTTTVSDSFDTDDPGAAMMMLEQMGVLSMAEDGCRLMIAPVLDRLATLACAAPRSRVTVALVPELLGHLARLGAHDIQLAGGVRRVRKSVGVIPSEWEGLVQRISRER